jgi:hypothetical protein
MGSELNMEMITLPVIISSLVLIVSYSAFQFGLFKWLIGRIDNLGASFKDELVRHQEADVEALRDVRTELQAVRETKVPRRRKRAT